MPSPKASPKRKRATVARPTRTKRLGYHEIIEVYSWNIEKRPGYLGGPLPLAKVLQRLPGPPVSGKVPSGYYALGPRGAIHLPDRRPREKFRVFYTVIHEAVL